MSENQAVIPIATMCRLLGVSPGGYYAWTTRQASRRSQRGAALVAEIRAAHAASRGIYGVRAINPELQETARTFAAQIRGTKPLSVAIALQ